MESNHIAYNKTIHKAASVVLVLLAIFLLAATINVLQDDSDSNHTQPQIAVMGTGEIFAAPDVSVVTFDVRKEAKQMAQAQSVVNDIVGTVIADLKSKGIAEKDIKTLSYTSYPVYDNMTVPCVYGQSCPGGKSVLRGYEASQTIQVKIRNVDATADIVSLLGGKGVTNISGPVFSVDDETILLAQARKKAIDDAQAKARILAKDLGVRLGRVVSFNESGVYPYPMYDKAMSARVETANVPAQIPRGENQFTSSVTIVYEIR